MNNLRIIKGKKNHVSLQERIAKQILNLSETNKNHCLELIMDLDADERMTFLNAFVVAVAALPNRNIAAA